MTEKEELKRRLREIEEKEKIEFREREYPAFEKLIGKCFKYKTSYSRPKKESDYWYIYYKVLSIKKEDLYLGGDENDRVLSRCVALSWHIDMYGTIVISPKCDTLVHCLGEEITEVEYLEARDRILKSIENAIK